MKSIPLSIIHIKNRARISSNVNCNLNCSRFKLTSPDPSLFLNMILSIMEHGHDYWQSQVIWSKCQIPLSYFYIHDFIEGLGIWECKSCWYWKQDVSRLIRKHKTKSARKHDLALFLPPARNHVSQDLKVFSQKWLTQNIWKPCAFLIKIFLDCK